ncbi:amidase [Agrococcus versicolor]|uniref:amidase n=1 Tax=Agrococcus versicolor TaxID=501482 RepID=UPI0031DB6198
MTALHELSAIDLWDALHRRRVSAREVAEHFLARIDADASNAFVTVTPEAALARADAIDAADDRTPVILGLPFADKDLVQRAGVRTQFGSRAREGFVPTVSDPMAVVLDEAGGVSLGKTATPELGFAGHTSSALTGHTTLPGRPDLGAGGSSGGAAAAVAAGLLPFAPGSDGGGSVRIPAAVCGLVGLKPSRGRVPAHSGVGQIGGLSVAGPIARTVIDAALLMEAMLGRVNGVVPHRTTLRSPEHDQGSLLAAAMRGEGRYRIAVLEGTPWDDAVDVVIAQEARDAIAVAVRELDRAGHALEELAMPPLPGYAEVFARIWQFGAASVPFDDRQLSLVEPLTRWLVEEGRRLTAVDVGRAVSQATAFERTIVGAFAPFDAVLTPTAALPPRPLDWYGDDPEGSFQQQVRHTPQTSFVNVAGLPAITLPVHVTAEGLPMGAQLIGRPGEEATLLAIGRQLERRIPWEQRTLARFA